MMAKTVRKMVFILAAIVILTGLGVGGYLYFKHRTKGPHPVTAAELQSLRIDLPENTANLEDGLIQFTVSLQADNSSTKKEISELLPAVQDAVNTCMRGFTKAQLGQPGGVAKLKLAIAQAIDKRLPTGTITAVYFSNIVIQ